MSNTWKYHNPDIKWNGYGRVVDISNMSHEEKMEKFKVFSEGNEALEKCLILFDSLNITTKACCKGQHLSVRTGDIPGISLASYIAFTNSGWQDYLSDDILEDKKIYLRKQTIHYYGLNRDEFFNKLYESFKTGTKDNQDKVEKKLQTQGKPPKYEYHKIVLKYVGFNDEQVVYLNDLYTRYKELNSKKGNDEAMIESVRLMKIYEEKFATCIKENNDSIK